MQSSRPMKTKTRRSQMVKMPGMSAESPPPHGACCLQMLANSRSRPFGQEA